MAPPRPLLLVPTRPEEALLEALGGWPAGLRVERCGLGVVAAAAATARLLAAERPIRVLLVGIAGVFDPARGPLGSAARFGRVRLEGVGVGARTPAPLSGVAGLEDDEGTWTLLELGNGSGAELLTVCAASADAEDAARRRNRHPEALGEDMEGFAVALACRQAGVPLVLVRGFSNRVGERDPAAWRTREALASARRLALELLDERLDGEPRP